MATVHGMLGQLAPSATVLTTVYTVPAGKHATVRVVISNRGNVEDSVRLAVSPNGAAISNAHYLAYDLAIPARDSLGSTTFTAGDADIVRVYSNTGETSFSVTGIEEDD